MAVAVLDRISGAQVKRRVRLDAAGEGGRRRLGWNYLALSSSRLFIARLGHGVTVVDTASNTVAGEIADSGGADLALPVPALGRGYTANEDTRRPYST